ncbi:VOC family protein [Clostridium sp. C8-1-8]|uniref:VOC family protein n=1 Tax=Clostridium sp. C8-1-8 TaxID=2698831 RepID=UPI00136FC49D|nr:VOC family protein [Clostridium sp. C8-1-8]
MFKSGTITIIVSDIKKAVQFYVDTLELKLQAQVDGHLAQVEAPGLSITLLNPNGDQKIEIKKSESISIGFEVDNLDSTMELLKARGIEFEAVNDGNAARLAYFNDPEGNSLYLIEVKPQAV